MHLTACIFWMGLGWRRLAGMVYGISMTWRGLFDQGSVRLAT
jgi:hypothetical protein